MMDPEIKARWVAALRSGEYEQGRATLRTNRGEYCCLGVLCDLVDPDGWSPPSEEGWEFTYKSLVPVDGVLPPRLVDELGLNGHTVRVQFPLPMPAGSGSEEQILTLTQLNDDGFSFDQIADIIDYFL